MNLKENFDWIPAGITLDELLELLGVPSHPSDLDLSEAINALTPGEFNTNILGGD